MVYILFSIALIVSLILGIESYMQFNLPGQCILSSLHKLNILTGYKVQYEPNRGIWHTIGWTGTALMVVMHVYSLRKKVKFMHEWGMLRHWLDFHIFCGILGPILITYHTTFKLGGIVAVSYWSLVGVAASGFFGRYIFGFIPRSIAGDELKMDEILEVNESLTSKLKAVYAATHDLDKVVEDTVAIRTWEDEKILKSFLNLLKDKHRCRTEIKKLNNILKHQIKIPSKERRILIGLLRQKQKLNRRLHFLRSAHRLFSYWHKFHMVFTALIYLVAAIHIAVYYIFRVKT
ncbi:MAG: hypothetical protein HY756_11620 [Nitrospirae bacterium]|nr:hypothetical protein [Nitrospirota bacterium]